MPLDLKSIPRPVKTYHTKPYPRIDPAKASFDGKGKTVVVTAGATGIGKAISKAFCEAGIARLVIISRTSETQKKTKEELSKEFPSVDIITHPMSVTDYDKIQRALEDLAKVDVLVLSHMATNDQNAPILDNPLADIQECYNTNVVANYNLIHKFLTLPAPAHRRSVISISSAAATFGPPGCVGYGPSKAALTQTMQQFALAQAMGQLPGDNAFFSIHPGAIRTPAIDQMDVPVATFTEWDEKELPAHFCVWLAGDEAAFLSGKFVWAQWDVDDLLALKPQVEQNGTFLTLSLVQ